MITIALVALSEASQKYKYVIESSYYYLYLKTHRWLPLFVLRNELIKVIDKLENNEFSDDELDYLLIEFRSFIADAKTFYLVRIHIMGFLIINIIHF